MGRTLGSLLCVLLITAYANAQRGESEIAADMLRRMDANQDGLLEGREVSGRARASVMQLAEQARLDVNQPLPIDRLERQLRRQGRGGSRRGGGGDDQGAGGGPQRQRGGPRGRDPRPAEAPPATPSPAPSTSTLPGFGVVSTESSVRGFGRPAAETPSQPAAPPAQQMDDRTSRFVERFMSQYDRNRNGRLESSEWEGIRWGADPKESDLNKDGVLTKDELAAQMANRFGSRSFSGGRRPGRGPGPGGDAESGGPGRPFFGGRGNRGPDQGSGNLFNRGGGGEGFSRRGGGEGSPQRGGSGGVGRRGGFGGRGFGPSNPNSGDPNDRIRLYAESLLRRYDRNGNNRLEKDEWSQMRERYAAADTNKDSIITVDELAGMLSNGNRGSGGSRFGGGFAGRQNGASSQGGTSQADTKKSYRFLSPAERLEDVLSGRDRDWFLERDQNGDGQIAMSEFSDSWSQDVVDEFGNFDLNSDGLLTPTEYLRSKSE